MTKLDDSPRMDEPKVAKVGVEGSNPFARSIFSNT